LWYSQKGTIVPKVEYVKESEAPAVPRSMSKSAQETLKILLGLKEGQVAKVTPDEGQTLRGLKASFSRVATGQKMKVVSYESPEVPGVLFVKRSK